MSSPKDSPSKDPPSQARGSKSPSVMNGKLFPQQTYVSQPLTVKRNKRWHAIALSFAALLWITSTSHYVSRIQHRATLPGLNLRSYPGEKIKWSPCGKINDHEVECSDINVPMDQFNATNSGDKTFNIPLIRLRGKNATQNMLLNPGGPGGSGFGFLYELGSELNTIVGENFHLLSFDPRGVNSSTPLASCYPDEETKTKFHYNRDDDVIRDSGKRHAWSTNYAKACAENMGEYGKYVNTPQTAADMNSILDALGQQDMVYWGFSYGTLLGQTYATMFPERSKRVIIDGVANQFEWYEAHILEMDFVDTFKVIDGFFDECLKAGDDCPLASFAKTTAELKGKISGITSQLHDEPLSVYKDPSTYGLIDANNFLIDGFFRATYAPKGWPKFAQTLANLLTGNATDALLAFTFSTFAKIKGDSTDIITLNDGISGAQYWAQGRQAYNDKMQPFYRNLSFAATLSRQYGAKQQWAIPRTHNYIPQKGVKTTHPLLILSTTYDPVCSLTAARTANEAFVDSRLVELKAYGHCSLAMPSLCIVKHVRNFLRDGSMPPEGATCEMDGSYFGKQDGKIERRGVGDGKILEAQERIAEKMRWVLP